jgi:hypothetical protein
VPDDERKRELKRGYKDQERARARARMPIELDELERLLDHLDAQDAGARCDRSLTLTMAWAAENGIEQEPLASALREFGGYRNCEVLANIDPDAFRSRLDEP